MTTSCPLDDRSELYRSCRLDEPDKQIRLLQFVSPMCDADVYDVTIETSLTMSVHDLPTLALDLPGRKARIQSRYCSAIRAVILRHIIHLGRTSCYRTIRVNGRNNSGAAQLSLCDLVGSPAT
jgi:hypothetical protein